MAQNAVKPDSSKQARIYGKFTIKEDGGLYLGSNPVPHRELHIDDVGERRRVFCRRYTNCLTHAAANGWPGFACISCDVEEKLSAIDQRKDLEGLARFLSAIELPFRKGG